MLLLMVEALLVTSIAWLLKYFYDGPPWQEEKYCREHGGQFMRDRLPVVRSTPDSERYLAMGRGEPQCWPFHARVLIPWLCGDRTRWWHAASAGSLIATGPALAWYATAQGLEPAPALAVVVAFTGLWGCFGLLTLCPLLVDAPALLVACLGAAAYLQSGLWPALIPAALLVGAIKETGPIWLAIFAWHPAALIGLVVPAGRWLMPHPPADHTIIGQPLRSAMMYRRGTLFDGTQMLFTWGIGLAALLNPSPQLWLAVGLAYLQPLVASDVSRLVHQVAPVVLIHAIVVIPESWLPLALALHLFNPFARNSLEAQPVRLQGPG